MKLQKLKALSLRLHILSQKEKKQIKGGIGNEETVIAFSLNNKIGNEDEIIA